MRGRAAADEAGHSDRELALAFQAGDPWAFEEIFRRYYGRAERTCRRYLANPEDAEEAAQETMMRVLRGLPAFRGDYALRAWVDRIARNVSLDALRARARKVERAELDPVDGAIAEPSSALACRHSDPAEIVESLTRSRVVWAALDRMPDHHRAALVLREVEGRSHTEIGDALGISTFQAKALIHRARNRFRQTWTGEELCPALLALAGRLRLRDLRHRTGSQGWGSATANLGPAGLMGSSPFEQVAAGLAALVFVGGMGSAMLRTQLDMHADRGGGSDASALSAPPPTSPPLAPVALISAGDQENDQDDQPNAEPHRDGVGPDGGVGSPALPDQAPLTVPAVPPPTPNAAVALPAAIPDLAAAYQRVEQPSDVAAVQSALSLDTRSTMETVVAPTVPTVATPTPAGLAPEPVVELEPVPTPAVPGATGLTDAVSETGAVAPPPVDRVSGAAPDRLASMSVRPAG